MNRLRTFLSLIVLCSVSIGLFGMNDFLAQISNSTNEQREELKKGFGDILILSNEKNKKLILSLASRLMKEDQVNEIAFYIEMLKDLSESATGLADLKSSFLDDLMLFRVAISSVFEKILKNIAKYSDENRDLEGEDKKLFYKDFEPVELVFKNLFELSSFMAEKEKSLSGLNIKCWKDLFVEQMESFKNILKLFFAQILQFLMKESKKKLEERRQGSNGSKKAPQTRDEIVDYIRTTFQDRLGFLFDEGDETNNLIFEIRRKLETEIGESDSRNEMLRALRDEDSAKYLRELIFARKEKQKPPIQREEESDEEEVVVVSDGEEEGEVEVTAPPILEMNCRRNVVPVVAPANVARPDYNDQRSDLMVLLKNVLKANRNLIEGGENVVEEDSELDNAFLNHKVEADPKADGFKLVNVGNMIDFKKFKPVEDDDEEEGEDGNWSDDDE